MSNGNNDLVTFNLDGRDVQAPAGMNLIDACELHRVEIPHYCYHPHLSVVGNCRMCLIELGMPGKDRATGEPMLNEDGSPKIMWMPKPAIGCSTKIAPGMHVKTQSDMVKDCRNGVMEFLLINHPLDCPICDQAGECRLQEFATDYGRGYSRFVEQKNVKPKRTILGPRVMLDDERCILCSRCIRFCQEVANDDVLGFVDRGSYSTLTCYPGKQLANNYSLNTVDICPVGALTSTDFRFKMRVWFLKPTKSIDTESSVGCNTEVWSREGKIYRITPRRNDLVNDSWMPDSGRALYKQVEAENRLSKYEYNRQTTTPAAAAKTLADWLEGGKVAFVTNGRLSVEEQFLLKLIQEKTPDSRVLLVAHHGEEDGLLLAKDRTPNVRGALVTGLTDELPVADLSSLAPLIESGEIEKLVVLNEDVLEYGLKPSLLENVRVAYVGAHGNATSGIAKLVIPGLTVFEKAGSFVNQQFRLQRFEKAVPGPAGVLPEIGFLGQVVNLQHGGTYLNPTVDGVWEKLRDAQPVMQGLSWSQIPWDGIHLESGPWHALPFPEGKSLHYDPAGAEVIA